MKKILITLIILIILLTSYICYIKIGMQSGYIKLLINDNEITLRKNTELGSLTTNIKIKNLNNKSIIINNKRVKKNETITINLDKLGKDIKVISRDKKYNIKTIPSDFPEYKVTGKSLINGNYTATLSKNGFYYMIELNSNGDLIYYKKYVYEAVGNFKRETDNRYSYIHNYLDINDIYYHNELVLLDNNFNEIKRIKYSDTKDIGIDNHDSIYLDDDHYIIATSYDVNVDDFPTEIGNSNTKVESSLIKEVKDGKLLWEFDSTKYTELYKYYNPEMVQAEFATKDHYQNYMHFNAMVIDPKDNNLIVSFRNICSIIKIDRKTGKIIWILGGKGDEFNMNEEDKFLFQHSIRFADSNKLLLYDNGNYERKSRIVTFNIDENNKTISNYKNLNLGVTTTNWGMVRYLGNNQYLVNYGLTNKLDFNKFEELDFDTGKVSFSVDFIDWCAPNTFKYLGG